MKIVIGIDDTDNELSRGTGFRSHDLGLSLIKNKLVSFFTVSRHQLFFDKRIPYTSYHLREIMENNGNRTFHQDRNDNILIHSSRIILNNSIKLRYLIVTKPLYIII